MEYAPGVYIQEVSSGIKPLAGVGTSTAAFIGLTESGAENQPVLITSWSEFTQKFGRFIPNSYLAYAVYGFLAEGGTKCYVVRVVPAGAQEAVYTIKDTAGENAVEVKARSKGIWGNRLTVIIEDATDNKNVKTGDPIEIKLFKLTVSYREGFESEYVGEDLIEVYDRISLFDIAEKINDVSAFVRVTVKLGDLPTDAAAQKDYANRLANGSYQLVEGKDNSTADPGFANTDFIGDESNRRGLHALDTVDNVNIIAIPDNFGDREAILQALNYCMLRKDCFFIADPPYSESPTQILEFKNATGPLHIGENPLNSSYGALYYPWVYINDPLTKKRKLVPPSGVVAGTYAYTDSTRGVHKAPAGTVAGLLDSVVDVETVVTKGQQEELNPEGINVIRSFSNGNYIWGARTLAEDSEWQYINIRRLLLYIEESIAQGTQWVVFEPNSSGLWGQVKRNITAFLTMVWRDGALYGSSPEEAFFVKVDGENNPPESREKGILNIEIGVAPVKPAEFVIIRVKQILAKS